ncbi:hypothetical protein [Thalassobellus suaedae]|uniref:Uncharacterized protein n=1 Tax=Thalassobellus suaedae TaxID=3074124 RepID=A0ABY9XZZ8_9FLAO|nr:hypothetical protein RHP51_02080 [Flavobacteriaceae bacterium HL-DH14]WNH11544.1 hypothetical protein RHP49_11585 [Flavobacteriaceae bacterium HL-DH10]
MDELDILKKNWNKPNPNHKKLSVNDIYPMLLKKSSSIVKMLFYISIAELIFWILVNTIPYFTSDSYRQKLNQVYTNDTVFNVLTIFSFAIIILFIYLLYKSYKSISVTDNAKKLMESILKTRKIIKYYVLYNLIMMVVSIIIGLYISIHNNPETMQSIEKIGEHGILIFMGISILFIAIATVIIWLFYKLIYGILLKRLNKNYKELEKLEL